MKVTESIKFRVDSCMLSSSHESTLSLLLFLILSSPYLIRPMNLELHAAKVDAVVVAVVAAFTADAFVAATVVDVIVNAA